MASICSTSYEDDCDVPMRATFVNLYKWPESDVEFIKSMSSANVRMDGQDSVMYGQKVVINRFSCRQLFLRSYPFTRDDDDTIIKCLGRVKDKAAKNPSERKSGGAARRKCSGLSRVKAASKSFFRRLLSCTAKF